MISRKNRRRFFRLMPARLGDAPQPKNLKENPEHSSGPISSLFVASDVADDIGNVLLAFFLVGDEG
jgi:hypothetical protein